MMNGIAQASASQSHSGNDTVSVASGPQTSLSGYLPEISATSRRASSSKSSSAKPKSARPV